MYGQASKESVWMADFLKGLGVPVQGPVVVNADNRVMAVFGSGSLQSIKPAAGLVASLGPSFEPTPCGPEGPTT
jgi:hypothetical protein